MEPYIGEIRMFAGSFAPAGWALCDGQVLQISDNETLFSLLGTRYGGDGSTTFALPDLRGRFAVHASDAASRGGVGGSASVTLTTDHLPPHTHTVLASAAAATSGDPRSGVWAASTAPAFSPDAPARDMAADVVAPAGGGAPVGTLPPHTGLTFIIALAGIFPPQP
ncbi:phage tail protein [Cellulomonas hominis]|uniref:phage tail protein n=1 Tax=Cellulomonas hominis TaxID=156981 RepID=UPI001B8F2D9A|nr:tail fiber protein [Cellulomonas hominis]VTR75757.1 hypothetical protein CHMI_00510 [Cellulomonas hominis]